MTDSWAQVVADAVAAGAAAGLKDDAQRVVKDAYAKVKDLLTGRYKADVGEAERRPSSEFERHALAEELAGADGFGDDDDDAAKLRGAISELVTVLRERQPEALAMANVTLERLVARDVVIKDVASESKSKVIVTDSNVRDVEISGVSAGKQARSDPPQARR